MFTLSLGERVLLLRRRAGLSQDNLARVVGTTRITINAIENERSRPRQDLTLRLAAALNTSVDTLRDER